MELFDSSKHGTLSAFFSHYSSSFITYPGTDFLLKPVFIRGFSGSLHLVLLFVLLVSWVWKKFKVGDGEGPKQRFGSIQSWYYKLTLLCCLGVSGLSLVFCLLNYFYWHRNDWTEEKLVTLFDLAIRTLAWGALCVYLHTQFSNSSESKFPNLLRVWWGSYFSISCYSLVIDILLYKEHVSLPVQSFVFDVVCVISGLFFIFVGFFGKKEGRNTVLEEPLLNGNGNAVSNNSKGGTPVTPYSNAGIFSILTFSWMGPLIAVGNKKTLDLEDVPELYKGDM
ncbi:ABC transporter C family member 3 [Prunus persica]|nr:ABC transporter C family member 3 [Prunus persica]